MQQTSVPKKGFRSILIKFLLIFLLFGTLLVLITFSVQRDLAETVSAELAAGRSAEELAAIADRAALNASLAVIVLILYTFFALFLFVAKWIRAVKRTEAHLTEIGEGRFPENDLRISGGDELSEMADVINGMKQSLREKERLRSELELARTIQAELLPDAASVRLPADCHLQGFMAPAREVGGDLYDFFLTDSDHLALVIADVSDKGAPAALFMATAKMCIKDNMMLRASPAEVLFRVNNRLLENNKSGLFVTAWIGEIDLRTGEMQYAMAGHPYPMLRRADTAAYEPLLSDRNLVLAGLPDFEFRQETTVLGPGDRLFLYTDGLDEARDTEGGFFGRERMKDCLDAKGTADVAEAVEEMKRRVEAFSAGREQADDLTMLLFAYREEADRV